jgi:hypothetical protein
MHSERISWDGEEGGLFEQRRASAHEPRLPEGPL